MSLRRVVLGVDGSERSDDALHFAARLALGTETEIVLVHGWSHPEFEGEGTAVVAEATAYLRDQGVSVRSVIEMRDPRQLLVEVARREEADAIIIGCRGQNLFLQLALGSVGEYLTHQAPCPVTVVRPGDHDADQMNLG